MIAILKSLLVLLPLFAGNVQTDGPTSFGTIENSEISSEIDAVESNTHLQSAATDVLICINDDCVSVLVQTEYGWILSINCGDDLSDEWHGSGTWGGTLCGMGVE